MTLLKNYIICIITLLQRLNLNISNNTSRMKHTGNYLPNLKNGQFDKCATHYREL